MDLLRKHIDFLIWTGCEFGISYIYDIVQCHLRCHSGPCRYYISQQSKSLISKEGADFNLYIERVVKTVNFVFPTGAFVLHFYRSMYNYF